ncbi:GNAT family N-acetyltransferase [Streptomyces canus]|uniref:GNAT family N-acetyltransferase n=1 Tax=Streptomyces canus TaxID=58343 RepID=UPI003255C835
MDVENLSGLQVDRADPSDWAALAKIDSVTQAGDHTRRDNIRRWCEQGVVLMARDSSGPLGYSVLEYTFFEQGFVTMLMVAPSARRRGVGARLLTAVESVCTTTKLFTSTNVSNHPMQQLLQRAGWHPVGLLHGLDEGDPELFYLCPSTRLRDATGTGGQTSQCLFANFRTSDCPSSALWNACDESGRFLTRCPLCSSCPFPALAI